MALYSDKFPAHAHYAIPVLRNLAAITIVYALFPINIVAPLIR